MPSSTAPIRIRMMMPRTPIAGVPAAPIAAIPIRRIPTAIIPRRMPAPAISPTRTGYAPIPTPVPPKRIRESREYIRIQSVIVYVPIPRRISAIHHVPIQRAAYRYGVCRTTETDDTHGIFVIILRAFETVYPLTAFAVRFLLYI